MSVEESVSTPRDWTMGERAIVFSRCRKCGHRWYLPRDACPSCSQAEPARSRSSGTGVVAAMTVVHRTAKGTAPVDGPVGLALIDLDEGVRVMGRCSAELQIGDRVRVSFTPVPYFERAEP